jgi:predicted esterase
LRNWPRKSILVCSISLAAWSAGWAAGAGKTPALAVVDPNDAAQWEGSAKAAGWQVITYAAPAGAENIDSRVQALAAAVKQKVDAGDVDPNRIYLAGRAEATPMVFYTIARIPDLWAAGIALGGSPQGALDTGRLFAANFTNTPVLWVTGSPEQEATAAKLKTDGLNLETRSANGLTDAAIFEWLSQHMRDPFPTAVDCETNSPTFASCYWLQPVKFDVAERNDVLPSSRIVAGSGASLDLGGFGYKLDDPGPGLLVSFLPEKYNGPLKVGDRIMELDGKSIQNARQYRETMSKIVEEKQVVVMVQRGKQRNRLETRIVVPKIDASPTARVQGKYDAAEKQLVIISRSVTQMRVTVPEQWAGAGLFWNGLSMEKIDRPGCMLLTINKELLNAAGCQ